MATQAGALSIGVGRERGSGARKILRVLYFPWCWLVFIPYLTVSTVFWGTMAVLTSFISRKLAHHCGSAWAWMLCLANFTFVRVRGREHLRRGQSYVIMCNHQSHFDILALYGHWRKQFRWVMKQELRRVPFLGWGCMRVGHVFIDRSNHERAIRSLQAAMPLLAGGTSLMFFPEGTRSRDGRLQEFKKGGFMVALQSGLPILPVSISGARHVLPGKKLHLLPGRIRIQIHPPIETAGRPLEDRDALMQQVAAVISSGLGPFEQRLSAEPE